MGSITIGGDAPVSVQSMTNTRTDDVSATLSQIKEIHCAGGELVRVAVPDEKALNVLGDITAASPVPVIADIHFKHELAMAAMDKGVDKLRINPGNIGGTEKLLKIARKAMDRKIPLRIGVNAGSIEKKVRKKHGGATPEALVESALNYIQVLDKLGFHDIIISLKASGVVTTYRAYRLMAEKVDYPFHIGITEAGPLYRGTIKSAVGIGSLLLEGLGDTVRVSLTGDPVNEIKAARLILQSAGVRQFGPELVSCPTCGRCDIDVTGLVEEVEELMGETDKPLKIAVMGCAVNGPGEAREADIGIAGSSRAGIIFRHGEIIQRVAREELMTSFKKELNLLTGNSGGETD